MRVASTRFYPGASKKKGWTLDIRCLYSALHALKSKLLVSPLTYPIMLPYIIPCITPLETQTHMPPKARKSFSASTPQPGI